MYIKYRQEINVTVRLYPRMSDDYHLRDVCPMCVGQYSLLNIIRSASIFNHQEPPLAYAS